MRKKIIIILFALIVLGAAAAAYLIPVSLDVSLNVENLHEFDTVSKDNIVVVTRSVLGKTEYKTDFKYEETKTEDALVIDVTDGRLSGSCTTPFIKGTLKADYDTVVLEGDRFKKSAVKVSFLYDDGKVLKPKNVECDAPDIFTEDTVVHVKTEYGEADIRVFVAAVNKVIAIYDSDVHQGDAFDESKIKVSVSFADGTTKDNIEFVCMKAPKYFNETSEISISTSYGDAVISVSPTRAAGIRFDGKTKYHENDVFNPGSMSITYEDEKQIDVDMNSIKWIAGVGETLKEGLQEVRFRWHGKEYSTSLTVSAANSASDAAREHADELKESVSSFVDDNIYAAVMQHENYYLTHLILVNPSSQIKGAFGGGIGYGYTEPMSSAAERTHWAVGINGSNPSSIPSVIIRDGELQQNGETNGSEICMTLDGVLFSPDAGKSGEELLGMGVTNMWWTDEPTLIQTGSAAEGIDDGPHCRTILCMKEIGEYYILSTVGRGMDYAECISILEEYGCTYARPLAGDTYESLMVGRELVAGTDAEQSDFVYFLTD